MFFILAGCGEAKGPPIENRLSAVDILAGNNVEGYLRADASRQFFFPRDHGPHDGFRNEWWYLTGNVATAEGRRFGYQVTFFKSALRPDNNNDCAGSNNWCTNHLWMGHAAVSDVDNQAHHSAEIFSRASPDLSGAKLDPLRVWIQDWQLFSGSNDFPWQLEVLTEDFALTLQLVSEKLPVLQGDNGLSQKSPEPGNASYYYSLSRMNTTGQLYLDGQAIAVSGSSWLDREWSTSALASDQSGWDWFSLQFDNGTELMYYQLRDLEGSTHANSSGNLTSVMGTQQLITPEAMALEEIDTWQAADGTVYTTRWRMQYQDRDLLVQAVFEDQLMDETFQYWEGAVDVLDFDTGNKVGQGYLEMVR